MTDRHRIDEPIVRFLKRHHVLTLATSAEGQLHCSHLFYAWMDEDQAFVFTSSPDTRHTSDALRQPDVAASVVLETRTVGKIQGVQMRGKMYRPEGEKLDRARKRYLRRFPYAAAVELELWVLEVNWAKMTDNTLGFGKKRIWERR